MTPTSYSVINIKLLPSEKIYLDASTTGWDAAFRNTSTGGLWDIAESDLHKNELEALAAYFALKAYCKILNNMSIHINVDNTSVVSTLNKKASHNTFIFNTVKKTWFFCIDRNIWTVGFYNIKSKIM